MTLHFVINPYNFAVNLNDIKIIIIALSSLFLAFLGWFF